MKKSLVMVLIVALIMVFAGCFPISLLLPPTFLPAGGFDTGFGLEMLVARERADLWLVGAQPRYGFADNAEGILSIATSPMLLIQGAFPLYLEAGGRLKLTDSPVISIYSGAGLLTVLGDGESIILPMLRIAPTIGFHLAGNTHAFLRGQAIFVSGPMIVVGLGLSGKHWILEGSVPLPYDESGLGIFLAAGVRF